MLHLLLSLDFGTESNIKLVKSKRTKLVLGFRSVFLLLGLFISPSAAKTDWQISPSNPTVGDTLKIKGTASPGAELGAQVSFVKELSVTDGRYQYSLDKIKIPKGKNARFTVTTEEVKNLNIHIKKLFWIERSSDASPEGIAVISKRHIPPFTYKVLIDGDAVPSVDSVNLKVEASQTLKANSKGKFEFNYHTSGMPAGKYTIKIGDLEKTIELKPGNKK
ncbi:hypothetical protein FXW07_18260 [Methanosarcina sp. DH1]|nr:hypothetical protein [Methanosarcina sp. DH1]